MSEAHTIGLGTIKAIRHDIAEVICHEGIEITLEMVAEYHQFLADHFASPCSVLVNKINAYTYTFEAQLEIGTAAHINSLAFVTYNRVAEIAVQTLSAYPRKKNWQDNFFNDKEDAIQWLIAQQENVNTKK
ncbi:hypothetical protein [Algibacillus agarilyticus]|uniref:hypothetical protein n=1 Tax=Algibacillus agarilyticus TaxID=2234133 RepID=UPI000DD065A8|nr:hypothetical protein [Algibacillus agarilyticus]